MHTINACFHIILYSNNRHFGDSLFCFSLWLWHCFAFPSPAPFSYSQKISSCQSEFRSTLKFKWKHFSWQRSAEPKIKCARERKTIFEWKTIKFHFAQKRIRNHEKCWFDAFWSSTSLFHWIACVCGRWFGTINPCHLPFWNDEKWIFNPRIFFFSPFFSITLKSPLSAILMTITMIISLSLSLSLCLWRCQTNTGENFKCVPNIAKLNT